MAPGHLASYPFDNTGVEGDAGSHTVAPRPPVATPFGALVVHDAVGRLLTVREVAARLRVSRATVYRLVQTGAIACARVSNSIRVPAGTLDASLRAAKTLPTDFVPTCESRNSRNRPSLPPGPDRETPEQHPGPRKVSTATRRPSAPSHMVDERRGAWSWAVARLPLKWYLVEVILDFADQATEDVFHGTRSKAARRCLPAVLWAAAQRKLDRLNRAKEPRDLTDPPGNRLEAMKGDYAGFFSIRVNDQYRIVFRFEGGDARQVRIVDYH
jgi:proteic killer suppression protein